MHKGQEQASDMKREIEEIPDAAERLLSSAGPQISRFATMIGSSRRNHLATVARGTSDHAAHFLKYAFEISLGWPGASLGPSLATIYGAKLILDQSVALSISQSGRSPDIVEMTKTVREGGARSLCLVNDPESPLAAAGEMAIDICAGPERSVAATKSFVCSVLAGLMLLSEIGKDQDLRTALHAMPERLRAALGSDWSALSNAIRPESSLFILGRGPSLAIAGEAALKLKETCGLHAEAYSGAEVMHGPVELVDNAFPVLAFAPPDAAEANMAEMADRLAGNGAQVFTTSPRSTRATLLPVPAAGHPLADALLAIVPFYLFAEAQARRLGRNPDRPARLQKVTETV